MIGVVISVAAKTTAVVISTDLPWQHNNLTHPSLHTASEMQRPCLHMSLVVFQLFFAGSVLGQGFTRQPLNIKGDLLILDVASLRYQGNHPMFPPFDENGCADACARTPGCNAWTYCSSRDGCGSDCKAYTAQHPQVPTINPSSGGNPTLPNPEWNKLPAITGFGPWGVTGNCKYECNENTCTPGDKWPYGLCSLKKLANPDKPEFWSTNPGEGYVSGYAKLPSECKDLTLRTCTRCDSSKDPSSCRQCANNSAFKLGMLEGAQNLALSKADGCSSCYDSSHPAKCVKCLTGNAPCAECALQQPDASVKVDVGACIDCTQKHGNRFRTACTMCAFLGAKQMQVLQCMACLDVMKPVACDKTEYQSGCWNPTYQSGACATCVSRASSFGTCLACMRSTPYSDNCELCSLLAPNKQTECYQCSKKAASADSCCYESLRGW